MLKCSLTKYLKLEMVPLNSNSSTAVTVNISNVYLLACLRIFLNCVYLLNHHSLSDIIFSLKKFDMMN